MIEYWENFKVTDRPGIGSFSNANTFVLNQLIAVINTNLKTSTIGTLNQVSY
jgi:hypothetical protein